MATPSEHNGALLSNREDISAAEIRAELERVLDGDPLRRSRRLQRFLSYITDLALAGQESSINEYLIGIEVFERGPDYDPSDDSVVRRQAHSLRQKLGEYYGAQGKDNPIRIEVPLGHYVPTFKPYRPTRGSGSGPAVDQPVAVDSAATEQSLRKLGSTTTLAVIALSAMLSFWIGRSTQPATSRALPGSETTSDVRKLWEPWFGPEQGPLIVFSSPYSGVVKFFDEPVPTDAQPLRVEMLGELDRRFRESFELPSDGHLYISPSRTETKSGESFAAVRFANLFARNGLPARATFSRLLSWDDFRRENLILLGHNEQSQWMDPLLLKYPLRLEATSGSRQRRIVNTQPAEGEQAYYEIAYAAGKNEPTIEFALVSMLPGTDGSHQILLVSGLNTQATLMAAEFLTDPPRVASLLQRLEGVAPDHTGPWRFQLLLSAEVRDKAPTGGAVELLRVLD